jgi:hypothetical protein
MKDRKPLARLGAVVATGLFTIGLAAFAGQTAADSGNGNGNGNSEAHRNDGDRSDSRRNDNSDNGNGGSGGPADQVVICHAPPGNADNEHTIEIGSPAVDAHVDNHDDDSIGPCDTAASITTPASTTTTVPTSTSTTTTTTSTTTSTTSTTSSSSTSPAVAPDAVADVAADAPTGQAVSLNVLANDVLGDPAATITQTDFDAVGACSGLSFELTTGSLSGAPTQSGACLFTYVIQNSAGFDAAAVLVPVVA